MTIHVLGGLTSDEHVLCANSLIVGEYTVIDVHYSLGGVVCDERLSCDNTRLAATDSSGGQAETPKTLSTVPD